MERMILTFMIGCLLSVLPADAKNTSKDGNAQHRAQAFLLEDNIHEALTAYAIAVAEAQDHRNAGQGVCGDLLAEYAYALALYHEFDASLLNIDRARIAGTKYGDFYAAQILTAMGYDAAGQKLMLQAKVPQWISASYAALTAGHQTTVSLSKENPRDLLKRANRLAANQQTIQSIALFEQLSAAYPNTYGVYVDYSTVWEKMGRMDCASELLKQGIDRMPATLRDGEKGGIFSNHLQTVEQKRMQYENASWFKKMLGLNPPRLMTYVGASMAKDFWSLNGRMGVYTSNKFSASLNVGISNYSDVSMVNIGLSAYKGFGIFVVGLGVNEQFSKEENVFSLAPSVGLSFLNKAQTSSFDITLNGYVPLSSDQKFSYSISVGKTIYFDLNGLLK